MTAAGLEQVVEVGGQLAAVVGLEEVVDATLLSLEQVLGHRHSILLLHEAEAGRLVTVGSRGYVEGGVGSEVGEGDGVIGMVATRRSPLRIGNLQRMLLYARSARRTVVAEGGTPGTTIPLPGLEDARSQLAVPLLARGVLVGVLAVESTAATAYDEADELVLRAVGHLVAAALEREHAATAEPEEIAVPEAVELPASTPLSAPVLRLRHYEVDGSTFLDDDYLIKGVAGRLLWKVVSEHLATGRTEFTNREARLDPALELPSLRDNFESRLILLKRRLEARDAPLRITSLGRGRFGLEVRGRVVPERIPAP